MYLSKTLGGSSSELEMAERRLLLRTQSGDWAELSPLKEVALLLERSRRLVENLLTKDVLFFQGRSLEKGEEEDEEEEE